LWNFITASHDQAPRSARRRLSCVNFSAKKAATALKGFFENPELVSVDLASFDHVQA
jgi:hypothetical protein